MINNYTVINNYIIIKRLFRQQCFYFFVGKVVFNALHARNIDNSKSEFDSSSRFLQALQVIPFARGNLCYSGVSAVSQVYKKTNLVRSSFNRELIIKGAEKVSMDTCVALLDASCP